jgi:hypothetical protein
MDGYLSNKPDNFVDDPVGHTPQVLMQGRKNTDSYKNSPVILLGLIPCNPTRTPTM